jgi:hypothetical protein
MPTTIVDVVKRLDATVCTGNADESFLALAESKEGKFFNGSSKYMLHVTIIAITNTIPADTEIVAYRDDSTLPYPTVRHSKCELLIESGNQKCKFCEQHRNCLRMMLSRKKADTASRSNPSSHANYRYLNEEEKVERLRNLHHVVRTASRKVERLVKRLDEITKIQGSTVDSTTHQDLRDIIAANAEAIAAKHPNGTFARVFWEQQVKASTLSDARQMRWHPAMIKWCLYLRHRSDKHAGQANCDVIVLQTLVPWSTSMYMPDLSLCIPTLCFTY